MGQFPEADICRSTHRNSTGFRRYSLSLSHTLPVRQVHRQDSVPFVWLDKIQSSRVLKVIPDHVRYQSILFWHLESSGKVKLWLDRTVLYSSYAAMCYFITSFICLRYYIIYISRPSDIKMLLKAYRKHGVKHSKQCYLDKISCFGAYVINRIWHE